MAEQLVDQHTGEDADEDADDAQAEDSTQTGVQRAVHHLEWKKNSFKGLKGNLLGLTEYCDISTVLPPKRKIST